MVACKYHRQLFILLMTILAVFSSVNAQAMDTSMSLGGFLGNIDVFQSLARVGEISTNGIATYMNNSYDVRPACADHTQIMLDAMTNQTLWALRMFDAMGKPGSDLLNLQVTWLGSYDECVETEALVYTDPATKTDPTSPFKGKYCIATYSMTGAGGATAFGPSAELKLSVGLCVPNSCNSEDAKALAGTLLSLIIANTTLMAAEAASCQEESIDLTRNAIIAISISSVLMAIVVVGTVYDVITCHFLPLNNGHKVHNLTLGGAESGAVRKNSNPICTDFHPTVSNGELLKPEALPSYTTDDQKVDLVIDEKNSYPNTAIGELSGVTNIAFVSDNDRIPKDNDATEFSKFKTLATPIVSDGYMAEKGVIAEPTTMGRAGSGDMVDKQIKTEKPATYNHGLLGKILLSFSLYTNLAKIMNTHQPAGALGAVNGIRFLGMSWVILGHSFYPQIWKQNIALWAPDIMQRLTFEAIINAGFSVDTFFTLSGLLLAYLSLKGIKKLGGAETFNWGLFYFHRFWRLTPPYMLTLMVTVTTLKYWSDGPMWPQTGDDCKDTWWTNLLYINNLVKSDRMCFGHSWYLANDMQFYVMSPLLLIPLYYSKLWGGIICLVFIVGNFVTNGVISSANDLSPNGFMGLDEMRWYMYVKPYCRVGPYVVGIFTGYLLYKTECKNRLPKVVNLLGWAIATVVALLVLYGLHNPDGMGPTLGKGVAALYNATSRTVWGVCVCWVVYACATGCGGPVNTFLSWKAFVPLSRLSYCAYLVHPFVQQIYYMSRRTLVYYTDIEIAFLFMGLMVGSYALALVVSLVFEAPMMGLEKVLLGRGKNS